MTAIEPLLHSFIDDRPLDWDQAVSHLGGLCARVALTRQHEALVATMQLYKRGLGHLGVSFVRPACDEWLWLSYVAKLDDADAGDLLAALGGNDSIRTLDAMLSWDQGVAMADAGFPSSFVASLPGQVDENKERIAGISERLNWPSKRRVPNTDWVAGQVGERKMYDFLYSATSRSLHFSVGEMLRRGWQDAAGNTILDYGRHHQEYLTAFAVDHMAWLLVGTLKATIKWNNLEGPAAGRADARSRAFWDWLNRPRVPLAVPEEYVRSFPEQV